MLFNINELFARTTKVPVEGKQGRITLFAGEDVIVGILYDNTMMDKGRWAAPNYVFAPRFSMKTMHPSDNNGSYLKGRKYHDYIIHAKDIQSDDLGEVLVQVRDWVNAVNDHHDAMLEHFQETLDILPFVSWELAGEAIDAPVVAKALGPYGSVEVTVTVDQAARMLASGYYESNGYQLLDIVMQVVHSDKQYNQCVKWQYQKGSGTIQLLNSGGGRVMLSAKMTDEKYKQSTAI